MAHTNTDVYTIAGHSVQFTDWRTRTSSSTTEHTELFIDGAFTASGRYGWINRPWQVFDFQSSREDAAREEVRAQQAAYKSDWMNAHGYARMTAKRREEWAAIENAPKTHNASGEYATCEFGFALAVWCVANCGARMWDGLDDYARDVLARLDHVDETHNDDKTVYLFASTPDENGASASFAWIPSRSTITH